MALLLLNRRPILPYLPAWLPEASLIVLTAKSALTGPWPCPDRKSVV